MFPIAARPKSTRKHSSGNPLVKPTGTPTFVSDALTAGMLVYIVDTGNVGYAVVQDARVHGPTGFLDPPSKWNGPGGHINLHSASGYASYYDCDPAQLSSRTTTTSFGTAVLWPGHQADVAGDAGDMGCFLAINQTGWTDPLDDLDLDGDLSNRPNGSGFTIGATFINRGDNGASGGQIWGMPLYLDGYPQVGAPNIYMSGGSDKHINCTWVTVNRATATTGDPAVTHPQTITSTNPVSQDALHHVVVAFVKNSGGVDVAMYIDGVLEASATAAHVYANGLSGGQGGDNENQYQIGCCTHVAGDTPRFNFFNGQIMQVWGANRQWSQSDSLLLNPHPYRMSSWDDPGDEGGGGGGGGGGGAWTPDTDTGMRLWWRSDTTDRGGGTNVSTFTDKSGNSTNGASTNGPATYNATSLNGHPGVKVDNSSSGTKNRFTNTTITGFNHAVFSIFFVFKADLAHTDSGAGDFPLFFDVLGSADSAGYSSAHGLSYGADRSGGSLNQFFTSSAHVAAFGDAGAADNTAYAILIVSDGAHVKLYRNGTLIQTVVFDSNLGDSGGIKVNVGGTGSDQNMATIIGDFGVTDTQIAIADFTTYTSSQWGL